MHGRHPLVVKQCENHQRGPGPYHHDHSQHQSQDADIAPTPTHGKRTTQQARMNIFKSAADIVQAQCQQRPHQQEAACQRRQIFGRIIQYQLQNHAHGGETNTIEDAGTARSPAVLPAQCQPGKGSPYTDPPQRWKNGLMIYDAFDIGWCAIPAPAL